MNKELFEVGLQIRREVLGTEYVDRSISQADDFNRPLQELVTEYCWGALWSRPGLSRWPVLSCSIVDPQPALGYSARALGFDAYYAERPSVQLNRIDII